MSDRFYLNRPLAPGPIHAEGAEAHHLAAVCRLRAGSQVCLFNGDGREYLATVTATTKRGVDFDITAVAAPQRELPFWLDVAAPLPRGDRAQFLVEKLTELGVSRYFPLRTERSVVHPGEGKIEKLTRYVIEASKQCGRNVLMEVEPMAPWTAFCRQANLPPRRLVAHPCAAESVPKRVGDVAIAVGPEGGFTEGEIALANEHGWKLVNLGARVLRIETAALYLVAQATKTRAPTCGAPIAGQTAVPTAPISAR